MGWGLDCVLFVLCDDVVVISLVGYVLIFDRK